jgi:polysaccharide pyruvyl transferase WcaK-like protein
MINYYFNYYKRFIKSYKSLKNQSTATSKFSSVGLINPSIGSNNLGDIIIYDAVYMHLREIFPDAFLTNYPSQLHRNYDARLKMSEENYLFVGGTNLLSSNMDDRFQWKIDPMDILYLKNKATLMGVGWWQYQEQPNSYTKNLFDKVLSKKYFHSVRDSYSEQMLKSAGVTNVINTTCPTLWQLSPEHCSSISRLRTKDVVTTLTFYHRNVDLDRRLMDILLSNYDNVYMWVQAIEDVDYLNEICSDSSRVILVPPTLEAYNAVLEQKNIEYLGTRLHAGVRALQKGLRTLIVAVDNRAKEIANDTNLNVIERVNVELCLKFINEEYVTKINLPIENIKKWKGQFMNANND